MHEHTYVQNTCKSEKNYVICAHIISKEKTKYSYSHEEPITGKLSQWVPSFLTPTPTSSSEKKSQEWAESQTLLVILTYKVKEGRWGGDGITSKEEKEQRNIENGTEKYDRNRQKGDKKKKKETSRLGNGIETEGKQGHCSAPPLNKGWTQHWASPLPRCKLLPSLCLTNTVWGIHSAQKPEFGFLGYPDTQMFFHFAQRTAGSEIFLPRPGCDR